MRFSSFACGCLCVAVAVLILAPRSGLLAPWAGDAAAQIAPSVDDSDADVAVGKNEAPIVAARGALYVGAVLDQTVKARFIVDSGATDVSISPEVARRLIRSGQLTHADYRGRVMTELADGSRVSSQQFTLRSIRVGDREVRNVTATISNQRGALLLGQSFLRRFRSWSVDNRRRVLVLD